MEEPLAGRPAYAGVDTHKETHTLALIDALGKAVGTQTFPATRKGYVQLAEAIGDRSIPVGVEGTGSYGAGLRRHLELAGFSVLEVERPRRKSRKRGKSDEIDALMAAKCVAEGSTVIPKKGRSAEDLRVLTVARDQAVKQATALRNCVDSMLVTASDEVRERYGALRAEARMTAIAEARPEDWGEDEATLSALRHLALAWTDAAGHAEDLERELSAIVRSQHAVLLGAEGVGAVTAARLVVAAGGNPERMGGEAAFSMLCGTSPIPASSGRTDRHRLNRGGNRQANRAIHDIAKNRIQYDEETSEYMERTMAKGKSKREATRCLSRYISREVYKLMTCDQAMPRIEDLVDARKALGLRQVDVAEAIEVPKRKIGALERGELYSNAITSAYVDLLCSKDPSLKKKLKIGYLQE